MMWLGILSVFGKWRTARAKKINRLKRWGKKDQAAETERRSSEAAPAPDSAKGLDKNPER